MNALVDFGMQWWSALRSTLDEADRRLKRRKMRLGILREVQQQGCSLYDDFLNDGQPFSEAFVNLITQVAHDLEMCAGQKIRFTIESSLLRQNKGTWLRAIFHDSPHDIRLCWALHRAHDNCRLVLTDLKLKDDLHQPLWYSDELPLKQEPLPPFFDDSLLLSCKDKMVASLFPYYSKELRDILDFKGQQHVDVPEVYPADAVFSLRYRLERGLYMDLSETKSGLRLVFCSSLSTSPDFGKSGEGVLFDSGFVSSIRGLRGCYDQFLFAVSVARSRFITSVKRHRFINEAKFLVRIEQGSVKFVFPSLKDGMRFLVLDVSDTQIQARFFSTDSRFTVVDIPVPEKRRIGRPFPSDKFSLELSRILRKLIGVELSLEHSGSLPKHLLQSVLGAEVTNLESTDAGAENALQSNRAHTGTSASHNTDQTKVICYDSRPEHVKTNGHMVQQSLQDPIGLFLQQTYGPAGQLKSSLKLENDSLSAEFSISGPHEARVLISWFWHDSTDQLRSRITVLKQENVVLEEELTQIKDITAVSLLLVKVKDALSQSPLHSPLNEGIGTASTLYPMET